jgi:hypothetical protein
LRRERNGTLESHACRLRTEPAEAGALGPLDTPGVGYQLIAAVAEAQAFRANMRATIIASASCLNGLGIFEVAACDRLYIVCLRRDRVEARAAGRAP